MYELVWFYMCMERSGPAVVVRVPLACLIACASSAGDPEADSSEEQDGRWGGADEPTITLSVPYHPATRSKAELRRPSSYKEDGKGQEEKRWR